MPEPKFSADILASYPEPLPGQLTLETLLDSNLYTTMRIYKLNDYPDAKGSKP